MASINVVKKTRESDSGSVLINSPLITGCFWQSVRLVVFGFLMVFSTTFDLGYRFKDNSMYYITRQMGAMIIRHVMLCLHHHAI
jgi:cell division protein FtsW (lipid II flippase)